MARKKAATPSEMEVSASNAHEIPILPPLPADSPAKRRFLAFLMFGLPTTLLVAAVILSQQTPSFYAKRVCRIDDPQCLQLSNQFLNTVSRLIGDIQNSRDWHAEFREDQINAWLVHDFQQNHADKALPTGVQAPRIEVHDDSLQLGFLWKRGPISTVVQISVRTWVPKRNLLCVELESVRAGWLPLPATYTQKVIEDFVQAQNLDVAWKRNGRKLVALIDFDRGNRQVVLRRVEINNDSLTIDGLGGRHAIPGGDYAPTAN